MVIYACKNHQPFLRSIPASCNNDFKLINNTIEITDILKKVISIYNVPPFYMLIEIQEVRLFACKIERRLDAGDVNIHANNGGHLHKDKLDIKP